MRRARSEMGCGTAGLRPTTAVLPRQTSRVPSSGHGGGDKGVSTNRLLLKETPGGGGSEANKKFVYLKSDSNFRPL